MKSICSNNSYCRGTRIGSQKKKTFIKKNKPTKSIFAPFYPPPRDTLATDKIHAGDRQETRWRQTRDTLATDKRHAGDRQETRWRQTRHSPTRAAYHFAKRTNTVGRGGSQRD